MGILKIDDVPPPLGAGGGHGDRPAYFGAGAATGSAGSGQATAGAAGVSAAAPPASSAASASAAAGGGAPGATASPGGQSVIPPHVAGAAPPPPAVRPPQAPPMSAPPLPDGPPASSMFDTSALTEPGPAGPAVGQAGAAPSASAPPIEPDPVRTLELKPQIVEQLSTVFDPEIPVNIYELGLIYDIAVDKDGLAVIQMTLTAPGCPAAVTLPAEVQGKVKGIDGVSDARVDLVWEPPWDKDRMSDAAKLQLGIFD